MSTAQQPSATRLGTRAFGARPDARHAGMRLRALPPPLPLPIPVVGALVYVGLLCLWLLYLRTLIPMMAGATSMSPVALALQLGGETAGTIRWASCVVGVLLVVFLWLQWRGTGRARRPTLLYLGTAVVVLLVHLALVLTLDGIPRFVLTPL